MNASECKRYSGIRGIGPFSSSSSSSDWAGFRLLSKNLGTKKLGEPWAGEGTFPQISPPMTPRANPDHRPAEPPHVASSADLEFGRHSVKISTDRCDI